MSIELKENEVIWIDGLNPVLDFINMVLKGYPETAEECFTFMRNKDLPRKDYNVVFEDRDLYITIVKLDNDDFRVITSHQLELIDQFLKEEESEKS